MKNYIIITGGCGFIGSNLIKFLLKKTNFKLICIDDYSSGSKKNHIKDSRVKYIKGHTKNIELILKKKKKSNSIYFSFWRIFKNLSKLFRNEQMYSIKYNRDKRSL